MMFIRTGRPLRGLQPTGLRKLTAVLMLSATGLGLSGCADLGVKPWERELLAKPSMQLNAAPLEQAADDHTYFSKEAATGGRSFGGGGCGCN